MTSCWISPESAAVSPAQKAQQPSSRGPYPQGTGTRRAQVRRSGIPAAPVARDCRSAKTQWLRRAPLQASDWTKNGVWGIPSPFWVLLWGQKYPAGGKPTESQTTGLGGKQFPFKQKRRAEISALLFYSSNLRTAMNASVGNWTVPKFRIFFLPAPQSRRLCGDPPIISLARAE